MKRLVLLFLMLICDSIPVRAVINFDAVSSATGNTNSLSWSHTTTGSELIMFVSVGVSTGGATLCTSATYNGVPMLPVDNQFQNLVRGCLWYLVAPATGTNTVIVNLTYSVDVSAVAVTLTGVHQTVPLGTSAKAGGTSTSPSVTVTSASGEVVIDALAVSDNPAAAVSSNQTTRGTKLAAVNITAGISTKDGATSTTMTWSPAVYQWAQVAVPVKPASVAVDATAPSAPTNLLATITGSNTYLSWTASTDNVAVTGYSLESCTGAACSNWAEIVAQAGTTYTNTGVARTNERYRVRARDAIPNWSGYSSIATPGNCAPGTWTLASREPATCVPYAANGIFAKRLPTDVMSHLATNSDAIASNTLTNGNTLPRASWFSGGFSTSGSDDANGVPIYYGQASDPIYRISACSGNCGTVGSSSYALNTYWHIPNQARGGKAWDSFLNVWDQTQNKVLAIYTYGEGPNGGQFTFPNCSATTNETACPSGDVQRAQVTDYVSDVDWGFTNGAGDSLYSAAEAGIIRADEIMGGTINHALYLNTPCIFDSPFTVSFPAPAWSGAYGCTGLANARNPTLRPKHGSLVFLDYTDTQIDAMNLPAWQKPVVQALSRYGGYVGDTTAYPDGTGFEPSRVEGGEAYLRAGTVNPVYAWLEGLGIPCTPPGSAGGSTCRYNLPYLGANIPDVTGPNCPSGTCDVRQHIHIADECIAKGLAGLAGGCGSSYVPSDTTAPVVSGISGGTPNASSTTITWTTDEPASSQVEYGPTTAYATGPSTLSPTLVTSHSVAIGGLSGSTTYHFRVNSRDAAGNLATSGDNTFATSAPPDVTAPTLLNVFISTLNISQATVRWTTDELSNSTVEYGPTLSYGTTATSATAVLDHLLTMTGLSPATTYYYRVKSADAAPNTSGWTTGSFTTPTLPAVGGRVSGRMRMRR